MTEYGVLSFADLLADPVGGHKPTQVERLRGVVDAAAAAEQAGFFFFGVGEHHFADYILSSPEMVLAAAASVTSHIRLGTSVTLLANSDPVRRAEQLATLDVLSAGRAEVTFARGVSERTAHAFGISDFDALRPRFEEYLRLLLRLFTEDQVTWAGNYRTPLDAVRLEPRPVQEPHDMIWIGGGLSNTSADLAASLDLPLFLPSLFRWPSDYVEIVERYRQKRVEARHSGPAEVGFPSYVHVAQTSQLARKRWRPYLENYRDFALSLRRSFGRPTGFDDLIEGPAICGSPAEVAERIRGIDDELGLSRHIFLFDGGGVPPHILAEQMELMATEVLPALSRP